LRAISARLNAICRLDDPSGFTRIASCRSEPAQSPPCNSHINDPAATKPTNSSVNFDPNGVGELGAALRHLRISRKEGHRFTASRSMVSRHVGPLLVKQDVLHFPSTMIIRQ
jgi:hypothetical protein